MTPIRWERDYLNQRIVIYRLGPMSFKYCVYRLTPRQQRGVTVATGTTRTLLNAKVRARQIVRDHRHRPGRWPQPRRS